ncbi:TPA: hypothetical protein R4S64_000609 [Kluyvera georgiana]|uniref:Uncharacterized protein n=1 Tax=Kluyvera georgiana ATCC 51603 TaxID=1354264 RepID=A0A1B7JYL6_9ENTR|nr:hypothetical protein [Kluyvera georgiana]OAT53013.1 hypothetical protein M989_02234 [Kluyvera georgiana ATCC 51603]HDG1690263.1 hypothetical protein [Kluyvera georgiana]HED1418649.1 hypothetical protein [Kluyvera georgiana]
MEMDNVVDLKDQEVDGAYPQACVVNTTKYRIHGEIKYAACSTDHFNIRPGQSASFPRGLCLLTRINATIELPDRDVEAKPYTSSGTSYSQFAVIEVAPNVFEVTRRT